MLTVTALIIAALMLVPLSAAAGPATDVVKTKQTELFKVVAQPKTPARQEKLRAMFDEVLSYKWFCKKSLNKAERKKLSGSERKEFCGLLTKLVRSNYKRNLRKMLDYDIQYVGEKSKKNGQLVKTVAVNKSDSSDKIEIDFLLKKSFGVWKIVDIVTERASLVKTYRANFLRILREKGFPQLIKKMEKKLAKLEKEEAST